MFFRDLLLPALMHHRRKQKPAMSALERLERMAERMDATW
jgi:hypothetical protein